MGHGLSLSDFEKGLNTAKKQQGLSNRKIANDLRRSKNVINAYVNNPAGYGAIKPRGRTSTLSDRDKRQIVGKASNIQSFCALK